MMQVRDVDGHLVCCVNCENGIVEQVRRDGAFRMQLPIGSHLEFETKGNKTKITRSSTEHLTIEYTI